MTEDHQYRDLVRQYNVDLDRVKRVLDQLPAMSAGYEPGLRSELLKAFAYFADLTPECQRQLPAHRAALGWNDIDLQEVMVGLGRVHADPSTPEEWIVHDAYVIENGDGRCLTPWGAHLQAHPGAVPPQIHRTPSPARLAMLDAILDRITSGQHGRPVRIAIDGGTAAGKTTLAEDLATRHVERDGAAIRASFDFFKVPPHKRSEHGFGGQVFDAESLIDELLKPLGPGGSRRYRVATYDGWMRRSLRDRPVRTAPENALAFVDGAFTWSDELRAWWDFWIFVEVDTAIAVERFVARDALWQDDPEPDRMRTRFRERYLPAESAYARSVDPWSNADVLVRNDDPGNPTWTFADRPTS